MEPLQPGDTLARYRLERPLGAGGMGSVWLAIQEGLGRRVALKVMHPAIALDPTLAARFRQEAEVAASFNHPGIVPVTDFGVAEGRPFLVMDFLEGESLDAILTREAPLPPERVAFFAIQVLAALETMHDRNIVHRDLKPDNIFVSASSGVPDIARLLDFGIARVVERDGDAKMTTTGQILGTPTYMSPEQAKGMPVTPSADLYALGVVMYESLTGRVPFEAENYHQLLFTIVEGDPPKLSELCPGVDVTFLRLVERAMAPKSVDRFQSATEMREALAPFAAMNVLRASSSPRATPSAPKSESTTDPLAATVTPEQMTPLAFDATMAPETQPPETQPPETQPPETDLGESGAAPAAHSLHPEPARKPWMPLVALFALAAVGAIAFFAAQPGEEVALATAAELAPEPLAAEPLATRTAERVDEQDELIHEESPEAAEDMEANAPESEEVPVIESAPEVVSDETEAPGADEASAPTNNTGAPPANSTAMHAASVRAALMHAASMHAASNTDVSAERRIIAPCGTAQHEMFLVRPHDQLRVTGGNPGGVGLRRNFFERVRTQEQALTQCFRGKYIRRGQDVHVTLDATGHVTNVRLRVWCPVPAEVQRCTERVVRTLDFSDLNPSAGEATFNLDIRGL